MHWFLAVCSCFIDEYRLPNCPVLAESFWFWMVYSSILHRNKKLQFCSAKFYRRNITHFSRYQSISVASQFQSIRVVLIRAHICKMFWLVDFENTCMHQHAWTSLYPLFMWLWRKLNELLICEFSEGYC